MPQPFSHATTIHLHLCAVAFLNNQQDPSPGQRAQPSTCTWKLWKRQFLTQELRKNKGKNLAAVSKEQFMLFLLATTFAAPHETYLGNKNCLLSAENFPKLTSFQHDCLNVPQMVKKGGPRRTMVIERRSLSPKQSTSNSSILNNPYFKSKCGKRGGVITLDMNESLLLWNMSSVKNEV